MPAGRPSKPLEQKRRTGRSPGRDSGGRALPAPYSVTQLPGSSSTPDVPDEIRTAELVASCFITRGRADRKPCEACLADRGVEAWTRLWSAGRSWLSVTTDIDVVKRICRARIDEAHLRLTLLEDGPFVSGQRGGLVTHPAVGQLRALNAEVIKLESLCGFTPSDRGRLALGEVAVSDAEAIIARRTTAGRTAALPDRAAPRRRAVGSGEDEVD